MELDQPSPAHLLVHALQRGTGTASRHNESTKRYGARNGMEQAQRTCWFMCCMATVAYTGWAYDTKP